MSVLMRRVLAATSIPARQITVMNPHYDTQSKDAKNPSDSRAGLVCDMCTSVGQRQWKGNVLSLASVCSHKSKNRQHMEIFLQLICPVISCWMLESYTESQLRYEGGGLFTHSHLKCHPGNVEQCLHLLVVPAHC